MQRLGLTLALPASPAAAQVDPAAQGKVMRFIGGFEASANLPLGEDARVETTSIDLNLDRAEEAR